MTTPTTPITPAGDELTPLTDPDNVRFVLLEDYEPDSPGFTSAEVDELMNTPPDVIASSGDGES